MDRISTATKAVDLYGAGKHGFKDGDLANSILPTDLNAAWFNMVQEELLGVIESSGQVAAAGTLNQVTKAIKRFAGANLKTVTAGASALTVDDAGTVLVDATGGNVTLTLPAASVVAGLGIGFSFYRTDSTGNVVTVNRAGADTIDGTNSFTIPGQFAYRTIKGNGNSAWATTSVAASASSSKLQSIAAAVAANAMTVTLNPTSLDFRSSALSVGVPNTRTSAAALTVVVPAGATLGTLAAQVSRIMVLAIDNASAMELAVVNLAGNVDLSETGLISTTALSAASDSPDVVYSTNARANVPYRVVGCIESTQAVAGNWATAPSALQGLGGLAFAALQSLGIGQQWVDRTGVRSVNTTYYNTGNRPRGICYSASNGSSAAFSLVVNGVTVTQFGMGPGASVNTLSGVVPPGHSYSIGVSAGAPTGAIWSELG